MECPKCGDTLEEGVKFCGSCGYKMEKEEESKYCPKCGNKIAIDTKFCNKCGANLADAALNSKEDMKATVFANSSIANKTTVNLDNVKSYNTYNSNYRAPKKSGVGSLLLLLIVLIVMFGAAIGGMLVLSGGLDIGFPIGNKNNRTVMIYMVGSDLESKYGAASMDIAEMLNSKYDLENIDILLFTGGAKTWQTAEISAEDNGIYHITEDGIYKVKSFSKAKMGQSSTLTKFLNYVHDNYKSENYDLVFWDHGGGPIYGYGLDEFSRTDMLTLNEIKVAISSSSFKDTKFELIGFDACLMSSVEVANAMKDYAKIFISSEETEPGYGWDYTFLRDVNTKSDGVTIGKSIVDYYTSYYKSIKVNGITISVLDLSKIDKVEQEMNTLFSVVDTSLGKDFYTISRARSNTKDFGRTATSAYDLVDLYDFIEKLPSNYNTTNLKNAIKDLVIYESTDMRGAHGVSVYFPYLSKNKIDKSIAVYDNLNFAYKYLAFVRNFSSKLIGRQIDEWDFQNIQPVSDDNGNVSVYLPDDVMNGYSKITYRIFEKTAQGNYVPRFQGTDINIHGNTVSTALTKKGITATDKDGNTIYLMAFEAETGEGYVKYLLPGTIEEDTEDGVRVTTVFVHFVVNKENPNGVIMGVTETEPDVEVAAKTIIDIKKIDSVIFMGTTEYKIFDANGNYIPNWEPVTDSKVEMIQEDLSDIQIEFKDLDHSKKYYCIFEVQDSQGNSYMTKPVEVDG